MSNLAERLHEQGYYRGVLATQSDTKLNGLNTAINGDARLYLNPSTEVAIFPLDKINPEQYVDEDDSLYSGEVAHQKAETIKTHYTGEREDETLFFAGDIVTIIAQNHAQLDAQQGYPLVRLSRTFEVGADQFYLSPQEAEAQVAAKKETLAVVERSNMVAICVNGNFVIEWRVGMTVKSKDGSVDHTHTVVLRSAFDALDISVVDRAFETPKDGSLSQAFKIGPRLQFAELAQQNDKIEVVSGLEETEVSPAELVQYVVDCGFPAQVIMNALKETEMVAVGKYYEVRKFYEPFKRNPTVKVYDTRKAAHDGNNVILSIDGARKASVEHVNSLFTVLRKVSNLGPDAEVLQITIFQMLGFETDLA